MAAWSANAPPYCRCIAKDGALHTPRHINDVGSYKVAVWRLQAPIHDIVIRKLQGGSRHNGDIGESMFSVIFVNIVATI